MDRVFASGAAGSPPSPPSSPSSGYPSAGNPGSGASPTKPGPWWYHMVTEELRKVVVDAGLTPDHLSLSQLSQAIQQMVASSSGGRLLRITRYSAAGSGTWNKQAGTNSILVRAVAGGGGGAGANSTSNIAGNGGYAGRYGEKLITAPAASYAYTVGAAGAGGAVNSAGSAGGQTSFGGMTLSGGPGGAAGLGSLVALPTGAGWDFTCAAPGGPGHADSTSNVHAAPGVGGASPFAGGGSGAGAATIPGSYGSGGSGGPRTSGASYAGSNGGSGYIEVWEFA